MHTCITLSPVLAATRPWDRRDSHGRLVRAPTPISLSLSTEMEDQSSASMQEVRRELAQFQEKMKEELLEAMRQEMLDMMGGDQRMNQIFLPGEASTAAQERRPPKAAMIEEDEPLFYLEAFPRTRKQPEPVNAIHEQNLNQTHTKNVVQNQFPVQTKTLNMPPLPLHHKEKL